MTSGNSGAVAISISRPPDVDHLIDGLDTADDGSGRDLAHIAANRLHERRRIALRSHEKVIRVTFFESGASGTNTRGSGTAACSGLLRVVGDDADDVVWHVRDPEARANRIAARKELSGQRLVDDRDAAGARVDFRERASRAHRHAERCEESLADLAVPGRDRFAAGRLGGDWLP